MRKIVAAVAVATALVASQAFAEPTRGFTLESAKTAADKSFSVDMVNTMNGVNQIRFGAFDGEVIINPNGTGTRSMVGGTIGGGNNASLGYKRTINDMFAAFGMLGLDTGNGAKSEFLVGGAFSGKAEKISFNADATLGLENDDMVLRVGGGVYVPLETSGKLSQFQVGGELFFSNRANANSSVGENVALGVGIGGRWAPRDNVTIDLLLLQDAGKSADTVLATPASVRVNLAF